jgi:hypothetical protein
MILGVIAQRGLGGSVDPGGSDPGSSDPGSSDAGLQNPDPWEFVSIEWTELEHI